MEGFRAARQDVTKQLDLECGADSKGMVVSSAATEGEKIVVPGPEGLSKVMNRDVEKLDKAIKESPSAITKAPPKVEGAKIAAAKLTSVLQKRKAEEKSTKKAKTAKKAETSAKRKESSEAKAGGNAKRNTKVKEPTSKKPAAVTTRSWNKLSESTLRRKTVKQLTEYLAEKVRKLLFSIYLTPT